MSKNPLRLSLTVLSVLALGVLACDGDDEVVFTPTIDPSAVASAVATDTPQPTAEPTPEPSPEPTVVAIDPCTLRDSLEGQPLMAGVGFELDAETLWQLCIGGAAAGSSEKYLYGSGDGGGTWTLLSMTTLGNPPPEPNVGELPNGNAAQALFFIDAQTGWLGLSSPGENLFRSVDGGVSWTFVPALEPGVPVLEIEFEDADNGTLTTLDGDWTTSDGGETWTETP